MEAPKYDNGSNDESSSSTPSFSNNQEDQEEPLVPGGFSNPLKTHDSYVQVSNSYPHHLPSQNIEEANCIMLSGGSDDSSVSLCCQKYTHWTKEHHMFFSMKLFIFDFSVYMFLILYGMFLILYIKLNMFILHVLFCDNRSFLLGLEKCGQGEEKWKKISTYFLT
ncbi:hypothetical protein GmHk_18G051003 [Glycine max]|nr:hypothetical protein GmHk_18G051003 [Glycine max]